MRHRSHEQLRHALSRRGLVAGAAALAAAALGGRRVLTARAGASEGIDFPDRIGALLAAAPARELDSAAMLAFYYADLAGQLASVGVPQPDPADPSTELPTGFFETTIAIPLAARAFETGLDPDWYATFGFNPYAVGQAMYLASPPNTVSMFRGGFDRETVEAALVESGYATILQETGGTYYTFGDDIAPDTPVGRLGLGTMNHAMVHDDLLVFAQREGDLQAVTQVVAGFQPSMADQELWSGMVPLFSTDTVGMIPLAPSVLVPSPAAASPVASPAPEEGEFGVQYLAFGVRGGSRSEPLSLGGEGTPSATPVDGRAGEPARVEVRIRYGSADAAAREAEAIPERWNEMSSVFTGQPYRELMALEDARILEREPEVVALDFVTEAPNRWSQMIHTRDLAPLAPSFG